MIAAIHTKKEKKRFYITSIAVQVVVVAVGTDVDDSPGIFQKYFTVFRVHYLKLSESQQFINTNYFEVEVIIYEIHRSARCTIWPLVL